MKAVVIASLVTLVTSFCLAEDHANSSSRAADATKRNEKYLELCTGKGLAATGASAQVDAKAVAAYDILRAQCSECHNAGSSNGGGLKEILNAEALIAAGIVTKGDAKNSTLIDRINDDMPLGRPKLSETEKIGGPGQRFGPPPGEAVPINL